MEEKRIWRFVSCNEYGQLILLSRERARDASSPFTEIQLVALFLADFYPINFQQVDLVWEGKAGKEWKGHAGKKYCFTTLVFFIINCKTH